MPEPASQGEVSRVDGHLILFIYLFRSWQLQEVVVAAEVLVVDPDVLEGYLNLFLV